jgi:hypothetical protein
MRQVHHLAASIRIAIPALSVLFVLGASTAQAQICVYVDTYDEVTRVSGNAVQGYVAHSLSGPCKDYVYPVIEGWLYRDGVFIQSSGEHWGSPGGWVEYEFEPVALSENGPGTYIAYGLHWIYFPPEWWEEYAHWEPPYGDNWDGWDSGWRTVVRPTITGWDSNGMMWYLGPGTASQVLAQDGNYYYQARDLTFHTNCDPGDTCEEIPQWTITTDPGVPTQATLSSLSGGTATINSGPNSGDCLWSTKVKASIGFETNEYPVLVASPKFLVNPTWAVTRETQPWYSGYKSLVYWTVANSCQPAGAILGLPLYETLGAFSKPQGVNWPSPGATFAPYFNYSNYIFYDAVGIWGQYTPVPTWTSYQPPFGGTTVLMSAPQTWRVGTQSPATPPSGTEVFSGTVEYYLDHGTSQ